MKTKIAFITITVGVALLFAAAVAQRFGARESRRSTDGNRSQRQTALQALLHRVSRTKRRRARRECTMDRPEAARLHGCNLQVPVDADRHLANR